MNIKKFFQTNWIHFLIIGVFFIITFIYFNPQFSGQSLKQHDVKEYIGIANEAYWYKDKTGQEQLWSNSMFGGMPTTQTSLVYPGNFIGRGLMNFVNWFPAPAGMLFLHLLGFYIMLLCFKVNKWIALIGAIAFAFSTYEITILEAGHNSKSLAVAFLPLVVGFFYLAYRHKMWLGVGFSALFMAFEISCNHLQVTYYLAILLLFMGLMELVLAFKNKTFKRFLLTSSLLIFAYVLAAGVNYGSIASTNEYAKNTIRGGNDLSIDADGNEIASVEKNGLDKDYITNWSYGIGESFTMLIPDAKGGASRPFAGSQHEETVLDFDFDSSESDMILRYPMYWGEQPMTSGPFYLGIVMVFLAFLGVVMLKNPIKWPLLIVGIIALMLSWGKNFMGFTDFWLDNVPGYNKFRTVTIILVVVELIVPLVAVLFLNMLIKERESLIHLKKKFIYTSVIFIVFLVGIRMIGLGDGFTSKSFDMKQLQSIEGQVKEQILSSDPNQLQQQYGVNINDSIQLSNFIVAQMEPYERNISNVKLVRESVFNESANRSIFITLVAFGVLLLLFFTQISSGIVIASIGLLVVIDMMSVSVNYLSTDEKFWIDKNEKFNPYVARNVDEEILSIETIKNPALLAKINKSVSDKEAELRSSEMSTEIKSRLINREKFATLNANTNYRVFDYSGGFNSNESSYFHKSLGGYHGAKLRTIQNVIDFHISRSNNEVFNMLNVKYFIQPAETGLVLRQNPGALGPVWFVETIKTVEDRNAEIEKLGRTFKLVNKGKGELIINGDKVVSENVFGFESINYVIDTDTIEVPLPNGLDVGIKASFVSDAYNNTNLVPQQTLDFDTLNSFKELVEIEVTDKFSPENTAVISKGNKKELKRNSFSGKGNIKMTKISPMKIIYTSTTDSEQFAVFSEIYYADNWVATIDGKEVPIYNVDYCLRGLEIPKGKHTIEFNYSQDSYEKYNTISLVVCLGVLLFLGGSIWMQRKVDQENLLNDLNKSTEDKSKKID